MGLEDAARLVGVTKSALERRIRQGEILTCEPQGKVLVFVDSLWLSLPLSHRL